MAIHCGVSVENVDDLTDLDLARIRIRQLEIEVAAYKMNCEALSQLYASVKLQLEGMKDDLANNDRG